MNWVLAIFALVFPVRTAVSWGIHGHKIVALVAEGLLSEESIEKVSYLIQNQSLPDIATWADEVDHTPAYAWSKCMHYIDSSGETCSVSLEHDCASGCCVLSAIGNYTSRLADSDGVYDTVAQTEALKFLVHLMGDVHQPLHAGNRANQGGNSLHVVLEFDHPNVSGPSSGNLHAVWDTLMIDHSLHKSSTTWEQYGVSMLEKVKAGHYDYLNPFAGDCSCSLEDIACITAAADESALDACSIAYVTETGEEIISGSVLTHAYYVSRIVTIEERLAMAGMRLGTLLNQILPTHPVSTSYIIQVI